MHDPDVLRAQIPVTAACVYLNTGGLGPVTQAYAETLAASTARDVERGRAIPARFAALESAREAVRAEISQLLGCAQRQVFLTRSTRSGIEQVIDALHWSAGDEIVTTTAEHGTCMAILERCARLDGVTLRIAPVGADADENAERIVGLLTPRTRLVVLSAVTFETGQRLPVAEVSRAARAAGIPTLIDGAQCAGAADLDVGATAVDYYALPLQKWLCGPEGLGALYARSPSAHGLRRPLQDVVTHGAGIFEATAASLGWLRRNLGWQTIFEATHAIAAYVRERVAAIDTAQLLTPAEHAGITTFRCPAAQLPEASAELARRGFVVRQLPAHGAFRLSTAFFTTRSEVDTFLSEAVSSRER